MKLSTEQKEINSTLRVVMSDVKEGIEINKEWILVRLKFCINKIEK